MRHSLPTCGPLAAGLWLTLAAATPAADEAEFFEKKVRPVLVEHCYKCHSAAAKELKGGLRLDLKAGWEAGGDSGEPSIVPGKPDESLLLQTVRHEEGVSAMPPRQSRLPDAVIADLTAWIKNGAFDPRDGKLTPIAAPADWETTYQQRLDWWSLKPVTDVAPPAVNDAWVRNDVDRFLLAKLQEQGLRPVAEADRRTLARRLSFVLTGLPPTAAQVEAFAADASPQAYEQLVQTLLDSPAFGEHWARHWMDVVHYSDTHGYEWDVPAKHAWRYRDYLIRAYNADLPFDRFVLEQVAGDLLDPRIDPQTGVNEALLGPMALRMGERRHGDSAAADGVAQEAVSNVIDTLGKGFLATTLACAQCHDHKLDAVGQRDYYALAGVFTSTRWGVRTVDAVDPNVAVLAELRTLKQALRAELAKLWLGSQDGLLAKLQALPANEKAGESFPESFIGHWQRLKVKPLTRAEFQQERQRRVAHNQTQLKLVADFAQPDAANGWQFDGFGMQHGQARDGDLVVADEGDSAIAQILPAGRWSHLWSQRLAGALRSPLFPPRSAATLSLEFAGGRYVAQSVVVDQAFHSERMKFFNQPAVGWITLTAGNFDTLEGGIDQAVRRVYVELVTKSLNNYFPPRTGYGGVTEQEAADDRSWFGVTRIYEHPPGQPPRDDQSRFAPLFAGEAEPTEQRFVELLTAAVERWSRDAATSDDARLLDEALRAKLLAHELAASPEVTRLVNAYRAAEKRLQPDRTIGTTAEWHEARDERIGIRGSYTELGDEVPRGGVRFLTERLAETQVVSNSRDDLVPINFRDAGRLDLAHSLVDPRNPLTARVYVNRVWQHLFGAGLVRTPDDFGHLGQPPSHPELLDHLAARFVREGWSTKKLITLLVTSAAWRQSSLAEPAAVAVDPENRLLHHYAMRRLEAESLRDAILAVSGRLDPTLYGPPIDPFRAAEDPAKRLMRGPLDGLGRRSVYTKMTLMEPPRLLALFNQPIPMLTVGRRDVTSVPDQALALLNDPFVLAMAKHWGDRVVADDAQTPEQRAERMFAAAFARPPRPDETARLVRLAQRSAELRGDAGPVLKSAGAWQDVAHALFNLKEFLYVP